MTYTEDLPGTGSSAATMPPFSTALPPAPAPAAAAAAAAADEDAAAAVALRVGEAARGEASFAALFAASARASSAATEVAVSLRLEITWSVTGCWSEEGRHGAGWGARCTCADVKS